MKWFIKALKHYADFSGRAQRKEYWMFVLFNIIFSVVWTIVFTLLKASWADGFYPEFRQVPVSFTYYVLMLLPSLAVTVRRLHDIGKSGGMIVIGLIPIVGAIWLLVLLIADGQQGVNPYGPDPKTTQDMFSNKSKTQSVGSMLCVSALILISIRLMFFISHNFIRHYDFSLALTISLLTPILLLFAGIWITQSKDIYKSDQMLKKAFISISVFGAISLMVILFNMYLLTQQTLNWLLFIGLYSSIVLVGVCYLRGTVKLLRYSAIALLIFSSMEVLSHIHRSTFNGLLEWQDIMETFSIIGYTTFIVLAATLLSKEPNPVYETSESDACHEADDKVVYDPTLPQATVDQQPKTASGYSMGWKIFGLFVSIGLIIGGMSGEMVLRGTNSSAALIIVGFIFLITDIISIVNHNKSKQKKEEYEQQIKSGDIESVKLVVPATIRVVRDSSVIGAIISYKVYLNHSFVGKIKNSKSMNITTYVSHNVITLFDHHDLAVKGNFTTTLQEGGYAEVHVKAGRLVSK